MLWYNLYVVILPRNILWQMLLPHNYVISTYTVADVISVYGGRC